MKQYKSLLVGIAAVVGLSSCNDWLDVNTNPNTPTIEQAKYEQLVPWSQFYMNHIYGIVASNSSFYAGHFYRSNAQNGGAAKWSIGPSGSYRNANAHQWFYTMVGNNYKPMYEKSMNAGAYHYAGVAKFLRAWGYFMLIDNMGEIPYSDACGAAASPSYDAGEYVYVDCIKELDEAIKLFEMTQSSSASPLSAADYWNGGDVQKWIKACYLFKARYMNHMSKKAAGKWSDGKYDEAEILACLEKAQKSNADNTLVRHTDTNTNSHDVLGWNEPVDYNPLFSCIGMNTNVYVTKTYTDNLTNFDGKGFEDPRADKFIPWARSEKSASTDPAIKWSEDGKWRRSLGVDIVNTNILSEKGPYALTFGTQKANAAIGIEEGAWQTKIGHWYCADDSRQNDTVYVWMMCGGDGYYKNSSRNIFIRRNGGGERAELTGVATVRATTPSYVASYAEACFIKAEVLMRKGDKGGAYLAYKNGVRASIDAVNDLVTSWGQAYPADAENPAFKHITDAEIETFMNGALGTEGDLTMGKIMTQKLLAMPFSEENWNDMRRFDYSPEIFLAYNKSYYYRENRDNVQKYCPEGSSPRRWPQASYETKYNVKQLQACYDLVPWASKYLPNATKENWYNDDLICTLPVWWDIAD